MTPLSAFATPLGCASTGRFQRRRLVGASIFLGLFYLLLAGLLALIGVRKLKKIKGPERAIRQAKASQQLLKR